MELLIVLKVFRKVQKVQKGIRIGINPGLEILYRIFQGKIMLYMRVVLICYQKNKQNTGGHIK